MNQSKNYVKLKKDSQSHMLAAKVLTVMSKALSLLKLITTK